MKFACAKCNHVLTNDLYLTTKIDRENIKEDNEIIFSIVEVKKGSYIRARYQLWGGKSNRKTIKKAKREAKLNNKKCWSLSGKHKTVWSKRFIAVNRDDATGCFLYPFETGNGCCANHYIEVECGNCYTQVGWEFYDCYETLKHVKLLDNKVVNDFSRRPTIGSPRASHVTLAPGAELTEDDIKRNVDMAMKAVRQGNSEDFVDPITEEMMRESDNDL